MGTPEFDPVETAKTIAGAINEIRGHVALIPALNDKLDALDQRLQALTERIDALNHALDSGKRRRFGRD